jgi:hypothetical protein
MADQELYLDLLKRCLTDFVHPQSSNQEVRWDDSLSPAKRHLFQFLNKRGYKIFKKIARPKLSSHG